MRFFLIGRPVVRQLLGLCFLLASLGSQAAVDEPQPASVWPTATAWRLTTETLRLPAQESMNWTGGNLLFDAGERLRLGVGSYGAMTGGHGGFITLGVAGELRERLSPSWSTHAGLFVGAGGGNSPPTLAGDGLMLRGDLGLSYETRYGQFGFGLSHVRFPTGEISSTQPYLLYEYPFYSLIGRAEGTGSGQNLEVNAAPLAARGQEFSLVLRHYQIRSDILRVDGQPQHGRMQLMGVEWQSHGDERWFAKLEAEGAMGGQSNGYMQILIGGGYRLPLARGTALKLHAAAGPAGGGGVDTAGGLLLDAGLALRQHLSVRTSLELSLGEVWTPSRSFQANSVAVKLNHHFGLPALTTGEPVAWSALRGFDPLDLRVRLTQQTYHGASAAWRNSFADQPVGNLGVQLDHFFSSHMFLTGQGLAAYAGHAGAYMTGQLGLGAQWPVTEAWFVEGEALLGAAGGGGLAVGSGLVSQVNASLGWRLSRSVNLLATAGRMQAANGEFRADVLGLSLAYQFTAWTQK
jgi:hypothetical protein